MRIGAALREQPSKAKVAAMSTGRTRSVDGTRYEPPELVGDGSVATLLCREDAGNVLAAARRTGRFRSMPEPIFAFAESLRRLLEVRTAATLERRWWALRVGAVGWRALAHARHRAHPEWEPALDEVDGLLLRLLDRLPVVAGADDRDAVRVRTFRLPELERLQHATAAALVAARYGAAGLRTVLADGAAPLGRRYFAFLTLAERHPTDAWPLFARYLTPVAHHAFVGAAAEAARFYPEAAPGARLVRLFDAVRADVLLRAFLSPRILESLYVLEDPLTLPFFRELLVAGHTAPDPARCEVTYALLMVRRFTGHLEPNSKYADEAESGPAVQRALAEAEEACERRRDLVEPVTVI